LIEDFQRRQKRFVRYRERFTKDLKVPYLEVAYESLLENHDQEMRRTIDFLGLSDHVPLTSDFVKVNSDSLEDIIENYSEIKKYLQHTEFGKYL
jgi:hypothetical protein